MEYLYDVVFGGFMFAVGLQTGQERISAKSSSPLDAIEHQSVASIFAIYGIFGIVVFTAFHRYL